MPALAGLLAAGAHMARQIAALDIDDPDQCLRLFKSNTIGRLADLPRPDRRRALGGAEAADLRPIASSLRPLTYFSRAQSLATRDDLVAVDDQPQAEIAGLAARQEARAALAANAALAARPVAGSALIAAPSDSSSVRATPSASISSIGSR